MFFGANLLLPLYNALTFYVLGGRSFPSLELAAFIGVFLLSVVAVASSSERVHSIVVVLYLVTLAMGFGGLYVSHG